MALSFTIIDNELDNQGDELVITRDDPRIPLIRVQEKQQFNRIKKMKRGQKGKQHNWLLWWVERISDGEDFDAWFRFKLAGKAHMMPESIYKVAIQGFLKNENGSVKIENDGVFSWIIDEKHKIFALPEVGVIAFFAPSGNLRKCIDPKGNETAWNWSLAGVPHGSNRESHKTSDNPTVSTSYIQGLQQKFGTGKGAVLGIIDSGVCPDAEELKGRVVATWAIKYDENGAPRPNYKENRDEIGHGTEAATIAAGKSLGVAPDAKIFSFKLPMFEQGGVYSFDLLDLATAFNTLRSELSEDVEGTSALGLIDTLLLPNGIYLSLQNRSENAVKNIMEALPDFNNNKNIVIVAAIGNNHAQVSFPASDANVMSVGAIDTDGKRWPHSGFGFSGVKQPLPTVHFYGCGIPCQSLNGKMKSSTGTSMAAAGMAGILTLLAGKTKSSYGRWSTVRGNIQVQKDEYGELPVLL